MGHETRSVQALRLMDGGYFHDERVVYSGMAITTDLIIYILICLLAAGFIRRADEVLPPTSRKPSVRRQTLALVDRFIIIN